MDQHRKLIDALIKNTPFGDVQGEIQLVETHISSVLLTGNFAYKFKKPVDFGFLNFSTLEARKHFCEEEIRLNQRLAPTVYLETIAITGTPSAPQINGESEVLEYAVKMHQFDQSQLLDNLIKDNLITDSIIDDIADKAAAFHAIAAVANDDSDFGSPEYVLAPMTQNFEQLRGLIEDEDKLSQLSRIEQWTLETYEAQKARLASRVSGGFIRECHGDMHLGNITLIDGDVTIFDGIEFNDEFRWIDVMSEMAFVTMDLTDRNAEASAQQLINRYLETTGDYSGVPLLRFYQVYRAMVRAKIASFRLADPTLSETDRTETLSQYQSYADLAEHFMLQKEATLILTHGVSGSGKSTISEQLLKATPIIRIRSDIERKRLFSAKGKDSINKGIYSPEASQKTYASLLTITQELLESGVSVIVDATFLKQAHRQPFQELSEKLSTGFHVIWSDCPVETLRQRITDRKGDISDATVEILEHQLTEVEPPQDSENAVTIPCENFDLEKTVNVLV